MQFSVLIPVYEKENAEFFKQALTSIWDLQTLKPTEVVIVEDGPLTTELTEVISYWKTKLGDQLQIVALKQNVGLGLALQKGLEACQYDWVARMDADDISDAERFSAQVNYLTTNPSTDLLGSHVTEFQSSTPCDTQLKKMPLEHGDIVKYSKFRNPLNHPSVIYKREAALEAGGYQDLNGMEDYILWVRMMISGARVANIDKSLVNMRVGDEFMTRRGGLSYAHQEIRLQCALLKLKYIGIFGFLRNLLIRIPIRLLPMKLRSYGYSKSRGG